VRRGRTTRSRGRARRGGGARAWLRAALLLALGAGVGWLASVALPGPLRPSADAAVSDVPPALVRIAGYERVGGGVEVAPADGGADVLLVVYPGGLVRPHAYTWLGVALAPVGVRTLIPTMPLDLAVLGRDRAGALIERARDGERRVVVAGHSLGGAMAAGWAARHPGAADGLILMGAYPAEGTDLRGLDLPTLVLAAEHDGLATLPEVRQGMGRLPARAGLEIVGGAVHAFFGRYGPQRGDGLPTVPRATAEAEIAGAVEAFLASLR
jgi:pimeloyl-ACP methyl ester carboxylesterase